MILRLPIQHPVPDLDQSWKAQVVWSSLAAKGRVPRSQTTPKQARRSAIGPAFNRKKRNLNEKRQLISLPFSTANSMQTPQTKTLGSKLLHTVLPREIAFFRL
jgi:hypothetical protein